MLTILAVLTGFEPAISSVTGKRDNHYSTEPGDSEAGLLPSIPRTDFAMNAAVAVINDSNSMGGRIRTLLLIGESSQTSILSNKSIRSSGVVHLSFLFPFDL
jgi:hypothetical protein